MMKRFNLIALLCLATSAPAAGLFGDDEDVIWRSGSNLYFKYAGQDTSEYGDNDHPVTLPAEEITAVLESLRIWHKKLLDADEQPKALFSRGQTRLLGKQLSAGLAQARPQQDIIFTLQRVNHGFLGLTDRFFLSGRAFYQQERLHIIIGEYDRLRNQAFESAYDPSGNASVPYVFYHGSRSKHSSFKKNLILIDGVEIKRTDELRPDWIVIDMQTAGQAVLAERQQQEAEAPASNADLKREADRVARERREMRAEMARMRKEMQNSASLESIEERIVKLDQLLDKGLITQEEYDAKRRKILNDL